MTASEVIDIINAIGNILVILGILIFLGFMFYMITRD